MKILFKTFFFLPLFTLMLQAQMPEKEVLLDKMIDVYGGEKNLAALNDYEQSWHIETKTSDTNGTDKRTVHLPISLKTELIYPNKTEIRTLTGESGTKQFNAMEIPVQGPMLDAMKLQLMRLFHPVILKEKSADTVLSETPEHYILSLQTATMSADYYVSKTSYLIDKVIGRLRMGSQFMEFLTLYEDYRAFHGAMIPYKEIKYAANINTAVMRLTEMHYTSPLPK